RPGSRSRSRRCPPSAGRAWGGRRNGRRNGSLGNFLRGEPAILPEPHLNPRSGPVGFGLRTVRQLFLKPAASSAGPCAGFVSESTAPGQRRAAEPPPSPTRHARLRVMIPLTRTGTASRAWRNGARSPDEVDVDPLAVAVPAPASRRFAVPEHHRLPGSARP